MPENHSTDDTDACRQTITRPRPRNRSTMASVCTTSTGWWRYGRAFRLPGRTCGHRTPTRAPPMCTRGGWTPWTGGTSRFWSSSRSGSRRRSRWMARTDWWVPEHTYFFLSVLLYSWFSDNLCAGKSHIHKRGNLTLKRCPTANGNNAVWRAEFLCNKFDDITSEGRKQFMRPRALSVDCMHVVAVDASFVMSHADFN